MMLHIEVLEDDTLYIEDGMKVFYYQLEPQDHVIVDLTDGVISISKSAQLSYPFRCYWKIENTLRPCHSDARLYMNGANDAYECAAKLDFLTILRDGKLILENESIFA